MLTHMLEDFQKGSTRATEVMEVEASLFKKYQDEHLDVKPEELEKRGGAYYSDAACNLISSIANDKRDIQVVNTRNKGAISSLPYEATVEISSIITKEGSIPLATGKLPLGAEGIVQQIKSFEKLTAEAALTGNYELAYVAMVTNPLVQSEVLGKAVLDELLVAHKDHFPQFQEVIGTRENNS